MVDQKTDKRPYERPSIATSEPFERLALACAGIDSSGNVYENKESTNRFGVKNCTSTNDS